MTPRHGTGLARFARAVCPLALTLVAPALAVSTVAAPALQAQDTVIRVASSTNGRTTNNLLAQPVTVDLNHLSVRDAVTKLAKAANVRVQFQSELLKGGNVSLRARSMTLGDAFDAVLAGTGLRAIALAADAISIQQFSAPDSTAKTGTISGRITGTGTSQPPNLPGVTVAIEGTKFQSITTDDGRYHLAGVPAGKHTLLVRLFGYVPQRTTIELTPGQQFTFNTSLATAPTQLAGVVTTATGLQKKVEVGNDITTINVDSLRQIAPISSLTDILESRVQGLMVRHTSGAPGAGSRLRIRGSGSISRSNDPILVVDGIRMNAEFAGGNRTSPIDQIDVNTIEAVEVFKGPSASALYGSDAANGVIVVRTKRGKAGPTRWTVGMNHGITTMPTKYAEGTYVFGRGLNQNSTLIGLQTFIPGVTTIDSIVKFQALNDPRYSIIRGRGVTQDVSTSVSGGSQNLTYSLTGTASNETGLMQLPEIEAQRFKRFRGFSAPGWMRNPDQYKTWSLGSSLSTNLGSKSGATMSLSNMLFNSTKQRSSMGDILGRLMTTYIDTTEFGPNGFTNAMSREQEQAMTTTTALRVDYPVSSWMSLSGTAGLSTSGMSLAKVLPRGYNLEWDSLGNYTGTRDERMSKTLGVQSAVTLPIGWGRSLRMIGGLNVVQNSNSSVISQADKMPAGAMTPTNYTTGSGLRDGSTTFGWFFEPRINLSDRFFINPGFRLDGGTTPGSGNNGLSALTRFPKINASWLLSDESFFPWKSVVPVLRLRGGYGYAGVQPGSRDRLRLYKECQGAECHDANWSGATGSINGGQSMTNTLLLQALGNTELRPERSRELEFGVDAELWNGRVSLSASRYEKVQVDAILSTPMPGSVGAPLTKTVSRNIGVVRNVGADVTGTVRVLEGPALGWDVSLMMHRNSNKVVSLAPGVRIEGAVGYPLFGRWARPISSYADEDGNGLITSDEVRLADSSAYVGQQEPKYNMNLSTSARFFNGRLELATSLSYEAGVTQEVLLGVGSNAEAFFGALDPRTPLPWQAALASGSAYGRMQTVDYLRWNSMSARVNLPASFARRMRASHMAVSLQASNLGVRSNYKGIDPSVSAYNPGINTKAYDVGLQPLPRMWRLGANLGW